MYTVKLKSLQAEKIKGAWRGHLACHPSIRKSPCRICGQGGQLWPSSRGSQESGRQARLKREDARDWWNHLLCMRRTQWHCDSSILILGKRLFLQVDEWYFFQRCFADTKAHKKVLTMAIQTKPKQWILDHFCGSQKGKPDARTQYPDAPTSFFFLRKGPFHTPHLKRLIQLLSTNVSTIE